MFVEEKEYRKLIQATFDRIERAFENVDPDLADCDQQQGALSIEFADGSRCILSAQPSVRQLWMAVASRGIAFHFNYDAPTQRWLDDKGRGVEVLDYLRGYVKEQAGLELSL